MKTKNLFPVAVILASLLLAFSAQPVAAQGAWNEESKSGPPVATVDTPVTVDLTNTGGTAEPTAGTGTVAISSDASPVAPGGGTTDAKFYTIGYELCRLYVSQGENNTPEDCRTQPATYRADTPFGMDGEAGDWSGQSFTATYTGHIVAVQLHLAYVHPYTWDGVNDGQMTLVLYQGAGNSGLELYRQAVRPWNQFCFDSFGEDCLFDPPGGDFGNTPVQTFVLEAPVPVSFGHQYTLYWFPDADADNASWLGVNEDAYHGGKAYKGAVPYFPAYISSERDAAFQVIIEP